MMKTLAITLSMALLLLLSACSSLDTYENRLEDAGWNVETASVEDLPDIIDSQALQDETTVVGVLYAYKTDSFNLGFIIEFDSSSTAQKVYDEMISEDDEYDNITQHNAFLFIGTSADFLEALGVD